MISGCYAISIYSEAIANTQTPFLEKGQSVEQNNPSRDLDHINNIVARNSIMSNAQTQFSFKLFQEISRQQNVQNIFISPLSVSYALSIALNGAGGNTYTEIAEALEFSGLPLSSINKSNAILMSQLNNADQDIELSLSNSIWSSLALDIKRSFLRAVQPYGAETLH